MHSKFLFLFFYFRNVVLLYELNLIFSYIQLLLLSVNVLVRDLSITHPLSFYPLAFQALKKKITRLYSIILMNILIAVN